MRHTVRAIILKDRHVLLVTGHDADFYWTPGGGVENGESILEALGREINEELGVTIADCQPYFSYTFEDQKVDNFIVTIHGDLEVGDEITGYEWFSSKSKVTGSKGFTQVLMPKLLEDGLIT